MIRFGRIMISSLAPASGGEVNQTFAPIQLKAIPL